MNCSPPTAREMCSTTKWIEVDAAAIRDNTQALREIARPDCAVMAVVKADGYGHGAVTAANAALAGGATWLGVSSMAEAIELRAARIEARVLNLGWTSPTEVAEAIAHRVDVAVFGPRDIAAAVLAAHKGSQRVRVHWKIDSGLGGLGTRLEDVSSMRDALRDARDAVEVVGIFTQFASADDPALDATVAQYELFLSVASDVSKALSDPLLHCANSAAALRFPEMHHDLIRPGLAVYGYAPACYDGRVPLKPALSVYALVTHVTSVNAGDTVGYGRQWRAERRSRLATVAIGYADGVDRRNGNRGAVIAGGRLCPIVGAVSMDQLSIDVTDADDVSPGDLGVLLGQADGIRLDAAAIAGAIATTPYEVLTGFSRRRSRVAISCKDDAR